MSEWGPWIEHDGSEPSLPCGAVFWAVFSDHSLTIPGEGVQITSAHPSWYWRWQRVRKGWFSWERKRVCDNPVYSPIIRYRVRVSPAMKVLRDIAENPQPLPVDDDFPVTIKGAGE